MSMFAEQAIGDESTGTIPAGAAQPQQQQVGPYRLAFEVASGGMATVYLAVDQGASGLGKVVALKRIHPHLAREREFVEMFHDEARLASMIRHPNVCGVLDFGETDGAHYLTMDYLLGEPLARVQRAVAKNRQERGSPKLQFYAARLIADAAEGLHAAHELRDEDGQWLALVHRDVSPHNLCVGYDGTTKVLDFGIATAERRLHHTKTGTVKGKFAYMAPEQMRGARVDRRADVWSLGVVLWETIALRRLFRRKSETETILAVAQESIPRLSTACSNVHPELERIVAKALSRAPEERHGSARELGRELSHFLAQQRESIDPAEMSEWMLALFPSGPSKKRNLLQLARQLGPGVPKVASDVVDEESGSLLAPGSGVVRRSRRRASTPWLRHVLTALVGVVGGLLLFAAGRWVAPPTSSEVSGSGETPTILATSALVAPPAAEGSGETPSSPVAMIVPTPALPASVGTASVTATGETAPSAPAAVERELEQSPTSRLGTVDVATRGGWAEVYLGRRRLGPTPGRFRLATGRRVLVLRPPGGGAEKRVPVRVRAGQVTRVRVELGR